MFRPILDLSSPGRKDDHTRTTTVLQFTYDGRPMVARNGDTLAAALLANGVVTNRETPISGAERGPFCMMGVCFECLVVIDGIGNKQACLTPVKAGMVAETQRGPRFVDGLES